MKSVRFTLISAEDLATKVESQICLTENGDVHAMLFNAFKFHALNTSNCGKLTGFLKKEENRNACLKGASVPDAFVKAIVELSDIAHKLKVARKYTSYGIVDDCNSVGSESLNDFKPKAKSAKNQSRSYKHCDESSNTNSQ